jgi:multicomponent K+:H+ antiporter subunit A
VYALLRRFRPAPESIEIAHAQSRDDAESSALAEVDAALPRGDLKIQAVLGRLLLPAAGLISVYFLLRGHDAPGGGFVGGLILATGIIAQYMVGGTIWVESRLAVHPLVLIGVGLLAAATAGLGAWSQSLPFLTALDADLHLPWLGDLHLSTVLLFDLGVYLLVVGGTLLILVALAHQSLRRARKNAPQELTEAAEGR